MALRIDVATTCSLSPGFMVLSGNSNRFMSDEEYTS